MKATIEATDLHQSLVGLIDAAATESNLNAALAMIQANVNANLFECGRGGHHIWLSAKTYAGPVRVALITQ